MERGFGKVFNAWLLTVYSQSPSFTPCWMVKKVKSRRLKSGVKPKPAAVRECVLQTVGMPAW